MKASLNIGIVSFAHGHVGAYARRIAGFDDARIIVAWDDDEPRGRANAEALGVPFSPHLEDVLHRPDVDVVIVASETNKHADLAVAALEANKPVLLQKPMATSLADCDRIIAAVERSGQWFSLAFQMRCDPQNIAMRDLVRRGAIGRVGTIRRRHCIGVLFDPGFVNGPTRWHYDPIANVGMFFDDATHAFDWLLWMTGARPVSAVAEIGNALTTMAPDDTGVAVFKYADGSFAEVYNSSVTWASENTTEIYGDQGAIIQNHGDLVSCALKPPAPIGVKMFQAAKRELGWQDLGLPIPAAHGERIGGVARPFIDAFRSGAPMCSAQEGRVSIEMAVACYRSSAEGKRVYWPIEQ